MELRVETAEGCTLPTGCHVGIRIGDVLKQGRYEAQRCYNFPQVERRRTAKIDLYQHIGSCLVTVDPEAKSTHEVQLQSTDPGLKGIRLKVNSSSVVSEEAKSKPSSTRETRSQTMKSQAKDYLSKHSVEERLSEAVKALLKEQPSDPTEFLCRMLRGETGVAKPVVAEPAAAPVPAAVSAASPAKATAQPAEEVCRSPKEEPRLPEPPAKAPSLPVQEPIVVAPAPQPSQPSTQQDSKLRADKDLTMLRTQAREVLVKASETGILSKVMDAVRSEEGAKAAPGPVPVAVAPAVAAPDPVPVAAAPAVAAPAAEVPELSPALVVSSVSMRGPTFATLGMPFNMMVF